MKRWTYALAVTAVCFHIAGGTTYAQEGESGGLGSGDSATVDRIMNTAVQNISIRYNLNDAQKKKTMEIMHREVYRFLKEHEDQVWPLVRDFLSQQGIGQPPSDTDQMKRIGKSARPMMDLIHEAIIRGNEEWRMTTLTEEQKAMHDYDMAEIGKTFDQANRTLDQWAVGDRDAGNVFPPPPPPNAGPAQPSRPTDNNLPAPKIEGFDPKRLFDILVDNFIKKYRLNQSQIDAARSILVEYRSKAVDFKNSHKVELNTNGAKWLAAQEAGDRKLLRQAEGEKKKLLAPVHVMRVQMEDRLMSLLTTAQKDRFASTQKGKTKRTPAKKTAEPAEQDEAPTEVVPKAKKASAKTDPDEPESDDPGSDGY